MICRKYDRPEVKQVTKMWVKENCKNITDRDIGLLRLLLNNKRRLLRRDQLERLYPEFGSTAVLNRRLKTLYRMHVLDKIYPSVGLGEGSSQQYICLDRAGILLLGLEKYNKPITTDLVGNRSLFLGWEHKVFINEYECMIREVVNNIGGKVILYKVEEPYYYSDNRLIPDMFVFIMYGGKGYVFYIEVDLGTEDIPYIRDKLDKYKEYYMSRTWVKEKWTKAFSTPPFPRVLFITEDGRSKRVKTLRDHVEGGSIDFRFMYHSEFKEMFKNIIIG